MTTASRPSCSQAKTTRRSLLAAMLGMSALGSRLAAHAADADWPHARPISIIVPSGAGSNPDLMIRLLTPGIGKRLGQQFVVEPRPGAAGIIGASEVAHARPDGYTLLYASAALASSPATLEKLPYDPMKAFTPIAQILVGPLVLISNARTGPKSMADFLATARARPGSMSYAHFGTGSPAHILMEAMARDAGLRLTPVPYKSVPQSIQDLLGGIVPTAIVDPASALPHVEAGAAMALALTGSRTLDIFPGTPTFASLDLRSDLLGWQGLFGPAGLPADIVNRLNTLFAEAIRQPQVVRRFKAIGVLAADPPMGAEDWKRQFESDITAWEKAARAIGLPRG